jgi:hypothetical protein
VTPWGSVLSGVFPVKIRAGGGLPGGSGRPAGGFSARQPGRSLMNATSLFARVSFRRPRMVAVHDGYSSNHYLFPSVIESVGGFRKLLARPPRVPGRRVQVFVAEKLGKSNQVVPVVRQKLVCHRVP